jgi:hypothetical protein
VIWWFVFTYYNFINKKHMDNNVQLDIATMALKGRRYTEAETIYMKIATESNSAEGWLGMAICKLYQLSEGRTMEEVIFCSNKAKSIAPDNASDIDEQLMANTLLVLKTYALIIEQAAVQHQVAKKQAQTAALMAGISLIAGMNSRSTFGTVASLAGTGAGVGIAVDSLNKMGNYEQLLRSVLNKSNEAYLSVKQNVDVASQTYIQFEAGVSNIIKFIENALLSLSSTNNKTNRKSASGLTKYLMLNASTSDKIKLIPALFGVHKFKEGKIVIGILYLITFGGYGVLWYLDSIKMLNGEYTGTSLLD